MTKDLQIQRISLVALVSLTLRTDDLQRLFFSSYFIHTIASHYYVCGLLGNDFNLATRQILFVCQIQIRNIILILYHTANLIGGKILHKLTFQGKIFMPIEKQLF